MALALALSSMVAPAPASAAVTAGFAGHDFSEVAPEAIQGGDVTGEKPESKLWWHDGKWWAAMVTPNAPARRMMYRLSNNSWVNTNVLIDERSWTHEDILSQGDRLWIVSRAVLNGESSKLRRYTYRNGAYELDAGFPVDVPGGGHETQTLARDTTGTLWMTWQDDDHIWVTHSVGTDVVWTVPAPLPFDLARNTDSDDVSSITAFTDDAGSAIGVMWSNQTESGHYFAVHRDGAADTEWALEAANVGTLEGDDHINLRTAMGRVFAAVKTSKADSNPAIRLLVRSPTGSWSRHVVAMADERVTRPIAQVVLDVNSQDVYVFMSDLKGIVYKKADMLNPAFGSQPGTDFIKADGVRINNSTGMKANATPTTDVVVLASSDSQYYWNRLTIPDSTTRPLADFSVTPTSGAAPHIADFTDLSAGTVTGWEWNFGDGTTSTDQSPSHTYTSPGTYTVSLTVMGPGGSRTVTKTAAVTVTGDSAPAAAFSATPTVGTAPLDVAFADHSVGNITAWLWNFGDGTTSNEQHPSHVYTDAGTYDVSLTVSGPTGSSTETKSGFVTIGAGAAITADAYVSEFEPARNFGEAATLRVRSSSTGALKSYLKFDVSGVTGRMSAVLRLYVEESSANGGTVVSTATDWSELAITANSVPPNGATLAAVGAVTAGTTVDVNLGPVINGSGTYSFGLVGGGGLARYTSREGARPPQLLITPAPPPTAPQAGFTAAPTSGSDPLRVAFTNTSTGDVDTWEWNFGDGSATSAAANPAHTYSTPGAYTVTLTARGPAGTDVRRRVDYITVTASPPVVGFTAVPATGAAPLQTTFTNTTTGQVTSWLWDFGDGTTSTERNPVHTYSTFGTYTVSLSASGPGGDDVMTKADLISVVETPPPATHITCGPSPTFACTPGGYGSAYLGWSDDHYGAAVGVTNGHSATRYAAYRLSRNRLANPNRSWGNASQWAASIRSQYGFSTVTPTPTVGAIAHWNSYAGGTDSSGHVAYVEDVGPDFIRISEDVSRSGGYTRGRIIPRGHPTWPSAFIHLADAPDLTGGFRRIDLNGDRRSDVAWVAKRPDGFYRLHYRKSGAGPPIVRGLTPPRIDELLFGDFDGNKITDYAFPAKVGSSYELRVRWNNAGNYQRLGPGPADGSVRNWRVGDFDGDGKSDIGGVIRRPDGTYRFWYRKSGTGAVILRGLAPASIDALLFGDFDGNKVTDYAFPAKVGSSYEMRVRWNNTGVHKVLSSGPTNGDVTVWRSG